MSNSYFQFKEFTVIQEKAACKVGTDGVLCGAWANTENAKEILDIGTGTGLISLMMAQKNKNAKITAIEKDIETTEEAKLNVLKSNYSDRIEVINISLEEYMNECFKKFDLIVSNPPFYLNSLKSSNNKKALANHTDCPFFMTMFRFAKIYLTPKGKIVLIFPPDNTNAINEMAETEGLFVNNQILIKTTPEKNAKRIIVEYGKEKSIINGDELVIEEGGRHTYSDKFKELTSPFYQDRVFRVC